MDIESIPPAKPVEGFLSKSLTIATIIGFIASGFGAGVRATGVISVFTLIVVYICVKWFGGWLSRNAWLNRNLVPARRFLVLAIALAALLIGTLLHQWIVSRYSVDVRELAESFQWKLLLCRHNIACIGEAAKGLPEDVRPDPRSVQDQLYSDQAIGKIVRESPEAMDLFNRFYGVDGRFLATGFSLPKDAPGFAAGLIPEYLIPNYPDTHDGILVWKAEPKLLVESRDLGEFIDSTVPMNVTGREFEILRNAMKMRLRVDEKLPAVIRFALIENYSNCLGRKDARAVFASHLGLMIDNHLTVGDASVLSGYHFTPGRKELLYVFVFIPTTSDQVVQPTWADLVSRLASDANLPGPCRQS